MFEQTFKNIDDVLWKEAGCATELDYTEQTSWILFLKYLDDLEQANEQKAELQGKKYQSIIDKPHRWSAWAAPKKRDGSFDHDKAFAEDFADLIFDRVRALGAGAEAFEVRKQLVVDILDKVVAGQRARRSVVAARACGSHRRGGDALFRQV
jgi:type I restriction enzyme M protein